jgi:starch phosphorylase
MSDVAIAYFSMEIGLEPGIPTYSGGLGVLAGDTLRSAADLEIPMVGVTLLHRLGYFYQRLDDQGSQREEPVRWPIDDFLEALEPRVTLELEGRPVQIRLWRYRVVGVTGHEVPAILLDTDLPENTPEDRRITDELYGGDSRMRLRQEAVLGIGGVLALRALGHRELVRFHLNEGHAALIVLALMEERIAALSGEQPVLPELLAAVSRSCVFTTHTPVPAGHDQFPGELVRQVLGPQRCALLRVCVEGSALNMTELALRGSRYINGVAMSHWEVSRSMFPGYPIHSITNGVHVRTWAVAPFQALYDRYLPDWRAEALSLRYAIRIPTKEIWAAHLQAKRALIDEVNRQTNAGFDRDVLTLGFARRATAYKRSSLIFHDLEQLARVAGAGPIQLVFAGKAHPRDEEGKNAIREVFRARDALKGRVGVAYLANHDMELAQLLCAGADVWLNTPLPPREASGTSGMKAAVNGVPSLSILDGWWVEGCIEGITGWAIGEPYDNSQPPPPRDDAQDAQALYDKLSGVVIPCFYQQPDRFAGIMRRVIALNAAYFNSERMLSQYLHCAYRVRLARVSPGESPRGPDSPPARAGAPG